MKIVDKIIDWIEAFEIYKKQINIWFNLKNTQIGLTIIMFIVMISSCFYLIYDAGFPWYIFIVVLFLLGVAGFYLFIQITRKKRNLVQKKQIPQVESMGLDFNRNVLNNIYYVLRGLDKIDVEKTDIDNFHSVLTEKFEDTSSEIHFIAMTWVELRYLLEKFKDNYNVEYSTFEKSNKLFLKGKPVTAMKLSNQGLRNNPEDHFMKKIDNCFTMLKRV